jgi:chondroitin 4-sulfotransferase 11
MPAGIFQKGLMIISDTKKYIFIHIPKAAGTSIKNLLMDNMSEDERKYNYYFDIFTGHINALTTRKRMGGEYYNSFFKFAFVRNPFDRLVSMYFSGKNRGAPYLIEFKTFGSFIRGLFQGKVGGYHHYESLSYFLTDKNNKIMVDFVGRFENLQKDFTVVADRIGIVGKLPHDNVSEHKYYRECYNAKTKSIIYKLYKKDFEIFGYGF